jgi:hypothetical protein
MKVIDGDGDEEEDEEEEDEEEEDEEEDDEEEDDEEEDDEEEDEDDNTKKYVRICKEMQNRHIISWFATALRVAFV